MPPGATTPMTLKRIQREIADLRKEDLGEIMLEPSDNMQVWKGSIPGPQGSVYEGGTFAVQIELPSDYPFSAPKVVFKTKIYHMNISEQGGICIDILKHNWSPALSLFKVMLSLSSLLTDPNPKDPLVPTVATQYMRNRKLHDDTARRWTTMYALTTPQRPPQNVTAAASLTAPPQVPGAAAAQPQPSPKSSRARGKKKETAPTASHHVAGSSRSTHLNAPSTSTSTTDDEVIVLESDEEDIPPVASLKGKKRKRPSGVISGSGASHADADDEVVDLVDSEDEQETSNKKTRTQRKSTTRSATATATSAGGSSSTMRRSARQSGDVIVIDD